MESDYRAFKTWAGLAATLISLIAARGGPGTNIVSSSIQGEWYAPAINPLDPLGTVKPGDLEVVISGCSESAAWV